jgi:NTE family protein
MTTDNNGKKISLVLGSGSARGLAHIGVIRWLEEHGYRIESIAGCSMGALIGGIHAAGKLDDYERWVRKIDKLEIFSILDFSMGNGGLVKGQKLMATLKELIGEARIEELPISFTAVAADIVREREVWISKGPLFEAIRASISMPLLFTPVKINGVTLIDGSVFNPVPIAPTFHDLTDLTVAVNLNGTAEQFGDLDAPPDLMISSQATVRGRLRRFFAKLHHDKAHVEEHHWDMRYVVNQSLEAMRGVIARQKLAAHPPDVLIEIARNACGSLEYDRADEMIALGYRKTQESFARRAG